MCQTAEPIDGRHTIRKTCQQMMQLSLFICEACNYAENPVELNSTWLLFTESTQKQWKLNKFGHMVKKEEQISSHHISVT